MALALARAANETDTPRSLRDVAEDAVAALSPRAQAAGVRIELAGAIPAVEVDARRVGLVLSNLLSNAIRFADLTKTDRWVRVRVERDRERAGWRTQVSDNGVGIAREAAAQMGSELALESVPGVGTVLTFTISDHES